MVQPCWRNVSRTTSAYTPLNGGVLMDDTVCQRTTILSVVWGRMASPLPSRFCSVFTATPHHFENQPEHQIAPAEHKLLTAVENIVIICLVLHTSDLY